MNEFFKSTKFTTNQSKQIKISLFLMILYIVSINHKDVFKVPTNDYLWILISLLNLVVLCLIIRLLYILIKKVVIW